MRGAGFSVQYSVFSVQFPEALSTHNHCLILNSSPALTRFQVCPGLLALIFTQFHP